MEINDKRYMRVCITTIIFIGLLFGCVVQLEEESSGNSLELSIANSELEGSSTAVVKISGFKKVNGIAQLFNDSECLNPISEEIPVIRSSVMIPINTDDLIAFNTKIFAQYIDSDNNLENCIGPVNYEVSEELSLSGVSPSNNVSPTFSVIGIIINSGTINLYSDTECTIAISESVQVVNGDENITANEISTLGIYSYYIKHIDLEDNESDCFGPFNYEYTDTPSIVNSGCQGDLRRCPIPVLDQSATTTEPNHCTADGSAGNNEAATQTYYRTTITGHGAQHASNTSRGYLWSSHKAACVASCVTANPSDGTDRQTCLRTNNCIRLRWGNLSSDTRFKVRIRSFSHPARYTFDSMGTQCSKPEKRYGTLRVTVGLKHPTSADYTSTTTLQADVGSCSNVANLSMPSNDGDQELRIIAVEWDYTCAYYKAVYNGRSTGGSDPNQQNNCPLATFGAGGFKSACWQIELQWSVDHTYDIPTES